jgi:uncharacterized protein YdiU (UPF0061 family)
MLRELKTKDIFKMSKILKKMGLKKDINVTDKSQQEVGAELILTVFENMHLAESDINNFLGDLCGMTEDEFSELQFEKVIEVIKEFKNIEGISNFFKSASQSTK